VADEALNGIDEAFARAAARPRRQRPSKVRPATMDAGGDHAAELERSARPSLLDHPFCARLFFAIQFLWGIALFLPNGQSVRFAVRALPYVSSLAFLVVYATRGSRVQHPRGTAPLIAALLLLVLNLLHPTSQAYAGFAQCIFQLSIAAPMFWMHKSVRSARHLEVLLALTLVANFASAAVGVLQVYFPEHYMPPQISRQLSDDLVSSMTYVGMDGRVIMRPPGLSDTPGGASVAGGLTALLGLGLCLYTRKLWQTLIAAGMGAVGLAAVYLTQVRSVLLMALGAIVLIVGIAVRQGRLARAGWGVAIGGSVIVASFLWAASIGGSAVQDRFLSIGQQGALSTYQENRGNFLSYTVGDLVNEYPLGAGVGRWGMMQTYFGDPLASAGNIHVEIQLTGWLLDGGIPMWVLYGAAILLSIGSTLGSTIGRSAAIQRIAPLVVGMQVFILGMAMAGPTFNMQLGILFWAAGAALHGASHGRNDDAEPGVGR
jgi:hypothetical protein